MIDLSPDQQLCLDHIMMWYKKDRHAMQHVTLGGYAGTGKTTLIAVLRSELTKADPSLTVGFASYTGKAARVLSSKLKEARTLGPNDSVSTIHSLIYSPIVNDREEIIGWKKKDALDVKLIIIDEGSMVDPLIWNHLLSYQIPIIVVGDHGQLPPIAGNFNLMQKPELRLELIHRQAKNNPIIDVSIQARETGVIAPGRYGKYVVKYGIESEDRQERMEELLDSYREDTLILCGYNKTRQRLNAYIRNKKGYETPEPSHGDRVICLRNNHKARIYNGMLGTIESIRKEDDQWYTTEIQMDGESDLYRGRISVTQFGSDTPLNFTDKRSAIMGGDLFDFGYATTVHKAQGSQARRVILFEERFAKMDDDQWRRWLYTAVTRAEEELYIFGA